MGISLSEIIEHFCPECNGTNVKTQSWLKWNKEKQDWEITKAPSQIPDWIEYCEDCEEEIQMERREILMRQ